MKLPWKTFEWRLRHRVRTELRRSGTQWAEYRNARKASRRVFRPWLLRLCCVPLAANLMMFSASLETVIALITLWTLANVCLRVGQLHQTLHYADNLKVFNYLPISDEDIFATRWKHFARHSLWSALEFSFGYGVLASRIGYGANSFLSGIVLGALQTLFIVMAATCLVALGPRKFRFRLASSFPLATVFAVATFGLALMGAQRQAFAEWIAGAAYWIPPVGWILDTMGIREGFRNGWWPSVMVGFVLAIFPRAYRWGRQRYAFPFTKFTASEEQTIETNNYEAQFHSDAAQSAQPLDQVESEIHSINILEKFDWRNSGWIERMVSRVLTPREHDITDLLTAGNPRWTAGMRALVMVVLLWLGASWLFGGKFTDNPIWLVFLMAYLFSSANKSWRGLSQPQGAGVQAPIYSVYPIGFSELVRVLLKIQILRYILGLPLFAGAVLMGTQVGNLTTGAGLIFGLKLLLLGLIGQPVLAVAYISSGTNDGKKPKLFLLALVFILAVVASVAVFIFASSPYLVVPAGLITGILSAAVLLLYRDFYDHNRFDLLPETKAEANLIE